MILDETKIFLSSLFVKACIFLVRIKTFHNYKTVEFGHPDQTMRQFHSSDHRFNGCSLPVKPDGDAKIREVCLKSCASPTAQSTQFSRIISCLANKLTSCLPSFLVGLVFQLLETYTGLYISSNNFKLCAQIPLQSSDVCVCEILDPPPKPTARN